MSSSYKPVRDVWDFEAHLASQPAVWLAEAYNLRRSAEVLFQYGGAMLQKETPFAGPAFFGARIQRMLMGFSLENITKALLLQDPARYEQVFKGEGKLSWGNDGHNLEQLFADAGVAIGEVEQTYLRLWQTCARWAGRYPLPLKEQELPRQRQGLSSPTALLRRARQTISRALQKNEPLLGAEIHDLLHQTVGQVEWELFQALFDRCLGYIKQQP